MDIRKMFRYQTIKVVEIDDFFLGLLHYSFLFLIFVYIVLSVIVFGQGYLAFEQPQGNVRLNLFKPLDLDLSNMLYCANKNQNTIDSYNPLKCEFWGRYKLQVTSDLSPTFFVATHAQYVHQVRNCTGHYDEDLRWAACTEPWVDIRDYSVYTAKAESFVLDVQHTAYAPEFDRHAQTDCKYYRGSNEDMHGEIFAPDGTTTPLPAGNSDRFSAHELMSYVSNTEENVHLDDICSDPRCVDKESRFYGKTYREIGMNLVVQIKYINTKARFAPTELEYEVKVDRIIDSSSELFSLEDDTSKAVQWRKLTFFHGIRLDFEQTGHIGTFQFQVLLVQLASSLGLLAAATLFVDQVAIRCLARKEEYYNFKYEKRRTHQDDDEVDIPSSDSSQKQERKLTIKIANEDGKGLGSSLLVPQPAPK